VFSEEGDSAGASCAGSATGQRDTAVRVLEGPDRYPFSLLVVLGDSAAGGRWGGSTTE
jgi:hypothetical protein